MVTRMISLTQNGDQNDIPNTKWPAEKPEISVCVLDEVCLDYVTCITSMTMSWGEESGG